MQVAAKDGMRKWAKWAAASGPDLRMLLGGTGLCYSLPETAAFVEAGRDDDCESDQAARALADALRSGIGFGFD